MQFFDYDEDLKIFNSLMEAKKKADPATAVSGKSAATSNPSDPKKSAADDKFKQSTITNKIKDNLNKSEKLNYKLFCATYWPEKYSRPFQLGKAGNYIVMNDPSVKDPPVKLTDNTHIAINLSALINEKTRSTMAKKLVGIQDPAAFAADKNTPYSEARAYIINEKLSKWLETVLDPDYEAKQLEKQKKKEARQKAKEEQNKQGNTEDNNPQDQQQQNPKNQQNPQGQNDPDTPSDEDDPKALYRKIRKNFQENYKDDLELECKNNADSLDDEGKDDLVDKYYDKAMEDFPDVYDNDVQEKVQDLVASYVSLYTKTNEPKSTESKDPDDDDMNWGPKTKPKDNQSDNTNTTNNKPKDKPKDKGYFNWLNNTINNWNQEGVLNQQANPKKNIEASHFIRDAKDWLNRRRQKKGTSKSNQHKDTDRILDED